MGTVLRNQAGLALLLLPWRGTCTVLVPEASPEVPLKSGPAQWVQGHVSEQPCASENAEQGRAGVEMPFVQRCCIKYRNM